MRKLEKPGMGEGKEMMAKRHDPNEKPLTDAVPPLTAVNCVAVCEFPVKDALSFALFTPT